LPRPCLYFSPFIIIRHYYCFFMKEHDIISLPLRCTLHGVILRQRHLSSRH
jgi:hypothetical protein